MRCDHLWFRISKSNLNFAHAHRTHTFHSISQNGSDKANQNEYQVWCDTIFNTAKANQTKAKLI